MQRFWHISDKSTKAFVPWGKHGSQHFQKSPTVAINGSIRPPNFQKNPYITKIIRPLPISRLSQFSRQNLVIFVGLCLDKFVCQYLENSTGYECKLYGAERHFNPPLDTNQNLWPAMPLLRQMSCQICKNWRKPQKCRLFLRPWSKAVKTFNFVGRTLAKAKYDGANVSLSCAIWPVGTPIKRCPKLPYQNFVPSREKSWKATPIICSHVLGHMGFCKYSKGASRQKFGFFVMDKSKSKTSYGSFALARKWHLACWNVFYMLAKFGLDWFVNTIDICEKRKPQATQCKSIHDIL